MKNQKLQAKIANLLSVKTLVTLILTVVFAVMTVKGFFTAEQFIGIFTVVIAFYFGTQAKKEGREEQ